MLITYVFVAILVSWTISVYGIHTTKDNELGQKFWAMQASAMIAGLMWPLVLFFCILVMPAYIFAKLKK
jgi:hypothetical protein